MARRKQEVVTSPVLEVLVTFRSGATTTVHMTEEMFNNVNDQFIRQENFFCPAPDYHNVYINIGNVDAMIVVGTVTEGDEYGDDEDQGPASTD